MSRLPPVRRILQAVLAGALWLALVVICIRAWHHGAWWGGIGVVALVLLLMWAADAFVPALGRGALQRGRRVPAAEKPRVALTFDDGPSSDTPAVLTALKQAGVRATFFVLGRHAEASPELVRAIVKDGHVVGNHTYSHRVLACCGARAIEEEVAHTQRILVDAGAPRPTLFRAPRGFQGPLVRSVLKRSGLRLIGWTRGAWDSERRPAETIAAASAANPKDGDILLLHDGAGTPGETRRDRTAEAIPLIVTEYRKRGFRFVTVPELLQSERSEVRRG